jgi:nitrate/nitrite-specific signal transduction histidine kinase
MAVDVDWGGDFSVPADLEPLAQSVLAEALRNIGKHATPTRVWVLVARDSNTFTLQVRNDGVGDRSPAAGGGMGLKLAAFEALQHGGVVESGPAEPGCWRVRLVVRLDQESS